MHQNKPFKYHILSDIIICQVHITSIYILAALGKGRDRIGTWDFRLKASSLFLFVMKLGLCSDKIAEL